MFFKFLIVSILVIYVLARFWGFIYRVIAAFQGKEPPSKQFEKKQNTNVAYETKKENNLQILIPKKDKSSNKDKPGEYIDFEEVKE
ncbi:DUF4834 family protein [Chondrinema litorale]|uniref:DUF4834 family protein n=1 Tax=Chondrinema litorale TaxID=2994555 RepID=UPI00254326B5|nr:DUF4834 family protein [Chondrinema litorale]UZR95473.1 DUF4834 family protein [Chondrinema litorale]